VPNGCTDRHVLGGCEPEENCVIVAGVQIPSLERTLYGVLPGTKSREDTIDAITKAMWAQM